MNDWKAAISGMTGGIIPAQRGILQRRSMRLKQLSGINQ